MCGKAVDSYPHALEFVPECYKTQKMCDKAADTYPSMIKYDLNQCKTQEMCDKAVERCPWFCFSINMRLKKCVLKL